MSGGFYIPPDRPNSTYDDC